MTPINLMFALKERIEKITKRYQYQQSDPDDTGLHPLRRVKVHLQHLPDKMYDQHPDAADFPFVIVTTSGGNVGEEDRSPVEISLIVGGYDAGKDGINEPNDNQGWMIPAEIMWCIIADLKRNPVIDNRYPISLPINWSLPDIQPAPQWLGSINLSFTIPVTSQAFHMQDWTVNNVLERYKEIQTLPRE